MSFALALRSFFTCLAPLMDRYSCPGAAVQWLLDGTADGRELQFVAEAIQRAPRNEAPWRYLTGLFAALEPWASQSRPLSTHPEVYTICTEALMDCPSCAPAYDVLAQYYEGLAALGTARGEALLKSQETGVRENVSATVGGVLQACEVAQVRPGICKDQSRDQSITMACTYV